MKVLVIADIHGNATALEAVLNREHDADQVVFLGDTVLAGPQPNETLALMRTLPPGTLIAGNHDDEVLDPSIYANFPAPWLAFYNWVVETFDPAGIPFIEAYSPEGNYEVDGVPLYLCHGMVEGGPRHTLPDSPEENFTILGAGNEGAGTVLFGHSHVQFEKAVNGVRFINPGSVGQSRCGRQLACYGLFEDGQYRACQVPVDPSAWVEALDRIDPLDAFPDFKEWLKDGMLSGFGVGQNEPWIDYSARGFN